MKDNEIGATAVELAVALPILLFMIFGIFQLLFLINARIVLDQAVYDANRTLIVGHGVDIAVRRAKRTADVVPLGPGFLAGRPKITASDAAGKSIIKAKAEIKLLPFLRQFTLVAGARRHLTIKAAAVAESEPFIGGRR